MSTSSLLQDASVIGGVALAVGLFAGFSLISAFDRAPAPAAENSENGSQTGKAAESQRVRVALDEPPIASSSTKGGKRIILALVFYCLLLKWVLEQPGAVPTLWWWAYLSVFSTVCLFYSLYRTPGGIDACMVVCFCYWHRSVFMHCTVERDCLFDLYLCSPLWGRTVACIGELAMVYLVFPRVCSNISRAYLYVAAIAVAECVSFCGVLTRQYWMFIIENGIWTVVAFLVSLSISLRWKNQTLGKQKRLKLLTGAVFFGLFFYNSLIDLPMYYARSTKVDELPGRALSLFEGFWHAAACHTVSQSELVWQPQYVWMGFNYTIAPVACLWVASMTSTSVAPSVKSKSI